MKFWFSIIGGILGLIYILNPTGGVFEIIPDIIPVVGNIDEAGATLLMVNAYKVWRDRRKADKNIA